MELGFGTADQQALLSSLSLQLEQLSAAMVAKLPPGYRDHLAGITRCYLPPDSAIVAGALAAPGTLATAVHHAALHKLMNSVFRNLVPPPDVANLDEHAPALDPEDAAAKRHLLSRLYRHWYLAADTLRARMSQPAASHTTPMDHGKQAWLEAATCWLADTFVQTWGLSGEVSPQYLHHICLTAIQLRMLMGYLQGVWPGVSLLCDPSGVTYDPLVHEPPVRSIRGGVAGGGGGGAGADADTAR